MSGSEFYLIKKSDLQRFIDSFLKSRRVFAPVRDGENFNFQEIRSGKDIDLRGYVNTEFPPKKFLLPEGEVLFEYESGKVKAKTHNEKVVIFGVRPCDTHAIVVLDRVMGEDPADAHYNKRRDSALVFALNCDKAGENCFCGSMDTSDPEGFDLLFTSQGKDYHIETGSKAGGEIVRKSKFFRKTGKKARKAKLKFRKKMNTKDLLKIMKDRFESKIWDDVASRCLSCGSCTSVCPTCYCFDISHVNSIEKEGGDVVRKWNYCMLRPFTRVAGEVYFREPRVERVKQFFYHKLVYGKENQGKFHCVGCGRCITECMTHIDITEEVRNIRREYAKRNVRS